MIKRWALLLIKFTNSGEEVPLIAGIFKSRKAAEYFAAHSNISPNVYKISEIAWEV